MILRVNLPMDSYDIILERGCLKNAKDLLNLNRKCLIVTDSGVPEKYAQLVASQCFAPTLVTIEQGEKSKNIDNWKLLLETMLRNDFTRTDCVVAVGGGVVGDLTGFVAASFMRGVDFYNIPTTLLSQVDSSVGGKVAVDLCSVKNTVGAFYQPKRVLIDPDVLSTLPSRHVSSGLAESLKMALTSDAELFEIFRSGTALQNVDLVIERSLKIKISVVEQDERESGLRKILNFGHTLGHGIETYDELSGLHHGECVGLGMLPMCSDEIRGDVEAALKALNLPTKIEGDIEEMMNLVAHDKKCDGGNISFITVEKIGSFEIRKLPLEDWKNIVRSRI
ncbi:MAG: 3-dehydroquinate synthase [Clostridia bacterium]|nr:3-dehydroquinate synthase [Clostridia bacterium]